MNRDNVSIKHVQKNRIFDLKSTFQDSIYQNNIHNCQYFEEHELNNNSGGGVGLWVENSFSFEPVECI